MEITGEERGGKKGGEERSDKLYWPIFIICICPSYCLLSLNFISTILCSILMLGLRLLTTSSLCQLLPLFSANRGH